MNHNISTPAVDLAATVTGQGPPLIILHGLFGSRRNWGSITRALDSVCECHALDLRNHGESPWSNTMDYPAMAADVAAYMHHHNLKDVTILGHSMGGKVAMTLALTIPEAVKRLLIADIAPAPTPSSLGQYTSALLKIDLRTITRRSDADKALSASIPDPVVRHFLLQNLVPQESGWAWRYNLPALHQNMDTLMGFPKALSHKAFDGPAAFLLGERSTYIKPEHFPLIRDLFPRASFQTIAQAGHWLHADQPAAFIENVVHFMAYT